MPAEQLPGESVTDYVERTLRAGYDLPPGVYQLDRTIRLD